MRIESLHFKNITEGWSLSETKFDDLNLLVGVSGAGKTQILEAIRTVCNCASEVIHEELKWELSFWVGSLRCVWVAETQRLSDSDYPFGFVKEVIELDGQKIIETDASGTKIKGSLPIKINNSMSALTNLNEDELKKIRKELRQWVLVEAVSAASLFISASSKPRTDFIDPISLNSLPYPLQLLHGRDPDLKLRKRFDSFDELRQSQNQVPWKLYFAQTFFPDAFGEIQADFQAVFPQVGEVRIKLISDPQKEEVFPVLQVKLNDPEKWIFQYQIASGMLKTLFAIGLIHLSAEGTVILIDELENSLGINCLDVVTERIEAESNRLQFILTSHHPYIINHIDREYWKIVTRKGGVITTKTPAELKMPESHHEPFLQLFNLKAYREGVQAA